MILSSAPAAFANFLSGISAPSVSLDLNYFLTMNRDQYQPMMRAFDGCLLVVGETQIGRMHELLRRIKPLFAENGTLVVFAINGYGAQVGPWFSGTMLQDIEQFFDHDMPVTKPYSFLSVWGHGSPCGECRAHLLWCKRIGFG